MQSNALKPYMDLMSGPDVRTIIVVLDGLASLLKVCIYFLLNRLFFYAFY